MRKGGMKGKKWQGKGAIERESREWEDYLMLRSRQMVS